MCVCVCVCVYICMYVLGRKAPSSKDKAIVKSTLPEEINYHITTEEGKANIKSFLELQGSFNGKILGEGTLHSHQ